MTDQEILLPKTIIYMFIKAIFINKSIDHQNHLFIEDYYNGVANILKM